MSEKSIITLQQLRAMNQAEFIEFVNDQFGVVIAPARKQAMLHEFLRRVTKEDLVVQTIGILEVMKEGHGFLRSPESSYLPSHDDVYVSQSEIKKYNLRMCDKLSVYIKAPRENNKYFGMAKAISVNDGPLEKSRYRPDFDDLIPVYPTSKLLIANDTSKGCSIGNMLRLIDLMTPLGKGQRALIVAPPRTGKTVMMQALAQSIIKNHPDVSLIFLCIDERPEEVTDMSRSVPGAEVISSTFDEPPTRHVQVTEMVIEHAKRLVEMGKDVVILLDSITRLARAYNAVIPSSGRVLTGGIDANAMQRPKRLFGAARNIENGGSLTIIGSALVETGSKMDDVIFEEFKGTGNAELILDRRIAERRIFPAIDIGRSGTRKEELLVSQEELSKIWVLRKVLSTMSPTESIEFLNDKINQTKDNAQFFAMMKG